MRGSHSIHTGEHQVEMAISVLQKGGLVAFPTDTLYALGAHAFIEKAVRRVYQVKDRPLEMAVPLLMADASDMEKAAVHIPQAAWDLADRFWPGALTLVLHSGPSISSLVTAGSGTVAVRVPNHPLALRLIKATGAPLTGTSANKSGERDPVTADEVRQQLGEEVDVILDDGACPLEGASTIVDVSLDTPRVVREGVIPLSLLAQVCPGIEKAGQVLRQAQDERE